MKAIKPIRTPDDYEETVVELELLSVSKSGTPEGDRFEILDVLVNDYERRNFQGALPNQMAGSRIAKKNIGKRNQRRDFKKFRF